MSFFSGININPMPDKSFILIFQPLEVVGRGSETQLQVGENSQYLFNSNQNICKSWCLNAHFIPNNSDLID